MGKKLELAGKKFGKLTAIGVSKVDSSHQVWWLCRCDGKNKYCKKKTVVRATDLRKGKTKSCGCGRDMAAYISKRTHGKCTSPIYTVWSNMKQRCTNPNNTSYKDYGGRGITICKRWLTSFENFHADMWPTWLKGSEIHRKNNNGPYSKRNCQWVTRARHKHLGNSRSHYLTINGVRKTVVQWAEHTGIDRKVIMARIGYGWSGLRLLVPVKKRK